MGDILQVAGSSSSLPCCSLMIYHHLTLMIMMMPLSLDHGDEDGHGGDEDEDEDASGEEGLGDILAVAGGADAVWLPPPNSSLLIQF